MSADKPQFVVRNKIWIEDGRGHVVFGLGRYRMLEAIQQTGSLQAAAAQMKMSYKALWLRVRASEERMGRSLVVPRGAGLGAHSLCRKPDEAVPAAAVDCPSGVR
jgi:molybdate transport system regulatory protein